MIISLFNVHNNTPVDGRCLAIQGLQSNFRWHVIISVLRYPKSANSDPMTAEIALRVGMAAGRVFTRGAHRHSVVIGKDTRLSGYMLSRTCCRFALWYGCHFRWSDAYTGRCDADRSLRADLGVVISKSHNPFSDNGIKLFVDGYKLSDETEEQIERLVESNMQTIWHSLGIWVVRGEHGRGATSVVKNTFQRAPAGRT